MRGHNRYINLTVTSAKGTRNLCILKRAVSLYESCPDGRTIIRADGQQFYVDQDFDNVSAMMNDMTQTAWNLVSAAGNPKEPGVYPVVLIYEEVIDSKPTGRKLATIDSRYFARANEDLEAWAMEDQDTSKPMYWTQETGSFYGESVYAWKEIEHIDFPMLPDGVEISDSE